jgi:hypothetical protein
MMYQDSWSLYDTPRHPKKWMFHPRKRSIAMPMLTIITAGFMIFELVSHI